MSLAEALLDLQELTRRLRRDCPWDREQTARTIAPHTVEEAYEVADAVLADDDEALRGELGDLLFQVYFLSLLLEERARATSRRSPASSTRSSSAGTRTSSARRRRRPPGASASAGTSSRPRARGARGSSTTSPSRCPR